MQDKTPVTIGHGWDFFTSEELRQLASMANTSVAELPFVPVSWFGTYTAIADVPLARKLRALQTGHIHKMRMLG